MEGLKKFVKSVDEMDTSYPTDQPGSQGSNVSSVRSHGTANGTLNQTLFSQAAVSQRIVNIEYYMSFPAKDFDNLHSEFRNSSVKKVPVIRIFGTTPAGQKMCANIHGVYPYISILDDETVEGFEYRIAAALDNAINDSVSNKFNKSYKKAATQHVFKVIRVVGKTFYGYRSGGEVFIRIFFYNPLMLKKAVDLLQSGNVLGRRFQPYESHIPFSLQFMIDYCLYGMNYIHYSAAKFRRNSNTGGAAQYSEEMRSLSQGSNSSINGYIDPDNIPESQLGPVQLSKGTLCELEVDVLASDIILETKISEKAVSVNPGIDSIWKDEIERRRLHGVDNCSQITIPSSQERSQAPSTHATEDNYMQMLCRNLESFFENTGATQFEEDEKLSFSNSSYVEDSEFMPSSQVLNHLSDESPKDSSVTNNQLSQEEDDFIKLLEKMAAEPDSNSNEHEIMEDPFRSPAIDNDENDLPDGDENAEEGVWDDSLLNASMLEKISDAEISYQDSESRPNKEASKSKPKIIFQCDGQGGESNSDSDDTTSKSKNVVNTRLSRRMSEIKIKAKDTPSTSTTKNPASQQPIKRKVGRPSTKHQSSPALTNRLSLTMRRKSRSQDTIKPKSQDIESPITSNPPRPTRRSRSMSLDKDSSKNETKKPPVTNSKKTVDEKGIDVPRRVTRKSMAAASSEDRPEKEKSSIKTKVSNCNLSDDLITKPSEAKVCAKAPKNILLNKQPIICLKKIDADSLSSVAGTSESEPTNVPKRMRRKPRRFLDEDTGTVTNPGSSIADEGSNHEEMLEATERDDTEEEPKIEGGKKRGRKGKKKNLSSEVPDLQQKSNPSSSTDVSSKPIEVQGRKQQVKSAVQSDIKKDDDDVPVPDDTNKNGPSESKTDEISKVSQQRATRTGKLRVVADTKGAQKDSRQEQDVDKKDLNVEETKESSQSRVKPLGIVRKKKKMKNGRFCKVSTVDSLSTDCKSGTAKGITRESADENVQKLADDSIQENGINNMQDIMDDKKLGDENDAQGLSEDKDMPESLEESMKEDKTESREMPESASQNLKSEFVDDKSKEKDTEAEESSQSNSPFVAQLENSEDISCKPKDESKAEETSHKGRHENRKMPKKKRLGLGISKRSKREGAITAHVSSPTLAQSEETKEKTVTIDENLKTSDISINMPIQQGEKDDESRVKISEKLKVVDFGVTCKPDIESTMSQTNPRPSTKEASVSAQPFVTENGSQIENKVTTTETQTSAKVMVSTETQTDTVKPLCLCQCTCVMKEKADASVDNQDELKPIMENKRIQVDNVDMIITQPRSPWFTTPQGNKGRRKTPMKSPDKRKSFYDSPSRRHGINTAPNPTNSRYLSALVLKTPTSHHKSRRYSFSGASPSTPDGSNGGQQGQSKTPPSRESREGFLISSIRASASPRKRTGSIRPRNLHIEAKTEPENVTVIMPGDTASKCVVGTISHANEVPNEDFVEIPPEGTDTPADGVVTVSDDDMGGVMKSEENEDLSVNSIYEYEEEVPSPCIVSLPLRSQPADGEVDEESSVSLTPFQRKRLFSKHRSKNRIEKKRAAVLDANRSIPDVFEYEYEPLKQPATYKSTMKWLDAERHRICFPKDDDAVTKQQRPVNGVDVEGESSDEESLPAPVKLFGGGNMSDEDSDSDVGHQSSGMGTEEGRTSIKPFTPVTFNFTTPTSQQLSQNSSTCNSGTPRSILRQGGSSRRQTARISKRKIRWGDDEPSKRIKIENGVFVKTEDDDDSQCYLLTNGSLNKTADTSELDGPSLKNALGLENSMSNFQDVKALHQCQFLTTMCIEVHCASRNELLPDPAVDAIVAIFVLISNDYPEGFKKPKECIHLLILDEKAEKTVPESEPGQTQSTRAYASEENLISAFISLVHVWDPDIFVGYEIEKSSFGYLIQRALYFGKDLTQELSRVLPIVRKDGEKEFQYRRSEEWNGTIGGRIVLNLWRLLRHEIAVQSYTFENAAYHILLRRVCKFSQKTLNAYWSYRMHRHKVIQYYTVRVKGAIQIMEKLDLVNRTSELARLFGIQFYEVLSRGSQFRVESMMLRATKPLDFIAPSPTVMQRAKMRAPEYLPLIMEPRSNYYTDPVAVLDFQSLYPSMMIAYNYDYASLLGRVEHLGQMERFPLGCLENLVSPAELLRLKDHIHISPAGVAFLDKSVVKGVLPDMLEQILDTRQMVKRAMKKWKNDGASLQKVLDSRQLGLKLIANVTYGYTSANFSGRMPCVEIADSIVSKGRETLQRAIDHVNENAHRWGAEVVYGDTDSMFILFRGKSRDEAFKLAYQIADEVTQANPKPVKLKFEKIYQPCILQSKKRYVGYAYETPDQTSPKYDAKGIETVRRDGCPAVRKILEKTLHVLFTSNKRENVEHYVKSQFEKLFKGRVSMQDYIFAREYRGRQGYKPTASVPSLEISKRLTEIDPRAEFLVSERVPYVVIYGNPTLPLIKLVRTPEEFLKNPAMRLNAHYYIEKVIIPALNRCLIHAGINATKWYLQLPRKYLRNVLDQKSKGQGTLDDYVIHQNCLRCDGKADKHGLCDNCLADESRSIIHLQEVLRNAKSKLNACIEICTNCAGETDRCVSVDCPILHKLTRYQRDQAHMKNIEKELMKLDGEQIKLEW